MDYTSLLAEFGPPRAKVDFITIRLPALFSLPPSSREAILSCTKLERTIQGRIETPKSMKDADRLTIHDPSIEDLQYLTDEFPDTEIEELEFAVDFTLTDGSNDLLRLTQLHHWIKRALAPFHHAGLTGRATRKYFDPQSNKYETDVLQTRATNKTVLWTHARGQFQIRAYIKDRDDKQELERHFVRIEVTLRRGGCQQANIHRLGQLPEFAPDLRHFLTRFFCIAEGIKPRISRTRSKDPAQLRTAEHAAQKERARVERAWKKHGAMWAAKHGYQIIPDARMNRLFGAALDRLRDKFMTLIAPQKSPDYPAWLREKALSFKGIGEPEGFVYRRASRFPLSASPIDPADGAERRRQDRDGRTGTAETAGRRLDRADQR
jgi:hypothetical protein